MITVCCVDDDLNKMLSYKLFSTVLYVYKQEDICVLAHSSELEALLRKQSEVRRLTSMLFVTVKTDRL